MLAASLACCLSTLFDPPDEGDVLHEREPARVRVLFPVGTHGYDAMVAQVGLDDGQQMSLSLIAVDQPSSTPARVSC